MRAALLLALLVAGCTTTPLPVPHEPPAPTSVVVLPHCSFDCYESSTAVDGAGRILATTGFGDHIARSTDNGTSWSDLGPIPLPPGAAAGAIGEDSWLTTGPDGRIYYVTPLSAPASPLISLQVAATADAGATWDPNLLIALNGPGHDAAVATDRPWLGFGGNGTVYLSYNNLATGIWLAHSANGGRSFSPLIPVTGQLGNVGPAAAGPPVGDASGNLYLPYVRTLAGTTSEGLAVAVSHDHGVTFQSVAVAASANWFPILSRSPNGLLWLAFNDGNGNLEVTHSQDAATWSPPETLSTHIAVSPWVAAARGDASVAWFESADANHFRVMAARLTPGAPPAIVTVAPLVAGLDAGPNKGMTPATDFAHISNVGGERVVVWADDADHELHGRVLPA
ncbi:MAG: sialidase family protein [Thermoplasmatota archaeon]